MTTCPVLLMLVSQPFCLFFSPLSFPSSLLVPVLNQLPLPSPLPATTTKSLLYNGRIAEEVTCLLGCRDENLASQLAHGLNQVSTEHMWVYQWKCVYGKSVPLTERHALPEDLRHLIRAKSLGCNITWILQMISKTTEEVLLLTCENGVMLLCFFNNWNTKRYILNEMMTWET